MQPLITFDHSQTALHSSLGISDERNQLLKQNLQNTVLNCLDTGVATINKEDNERYSLSIDISKLVYEVTKTAETPAELVICTMYVKDVEQRITKHCELEMFKQRLQSELEEEN